MSELPDLPECWTGSAVKVTWAEDGETTTRKVYTDDQMRRYALDAIELNRRHDPAPAGVRADARKGFFDIDSGRACIVDRFNWPNHSGFKNVWIVDAVQGEQPGAVVDAFPFKVVEMPMPLGVIGALFDPQTMRPLAIIADDTLTNTDKGSI